MFGIIVSATLFLDWWSEINAAETQRAAEKHEPESFSPASGPSALNALPVANAADATEKAIWCPDNGDGTYKNPIIFADYSDPDVIRVGDDFYLTASSFSCFPGLPVLHSKDLVNWTIIGHAINKHPVAEQFAAPFHGGGMWAPAIRYHDGAFYIFVGDPDNGIYMVKAKNPAGPWDPPGTGQAGQRLDRHLPILGRRRPGLSGPCLCRLARGHQQHTAHQPHEPGRHKTAGRGQAGGRWHRRPISHH